MKKTTIVIEVTTKKLVPSHEDGGMGKRIPNKEWEEMIHSEIGGLIKHYVNKMLEDDLLESEASGEGFNKLADYGDIKVEIFDNIPKEIREKLKAWKVAREI